VLSGRWLGVMLVIGMLLAIALSWAARGEHTAAAGATAAGAPDDGGITLPAGFCATVFADNVGHARHLVVAPNGVVYVNTWRSSTAYRSRSSTWG
jgi:glucose/arabinose dehydrogenase